MVEKTENERKNITSHDDRFRLNKHQKQDAAELESNTPYIGRAIQGVLVLQYRVFWSTKIGCFPNG